MDIFGWRDHLILWPLMITTIPIAIFLGCCRGKSKTPSEHFLGSRTLGVLPVGLSLIASYASGSVRVAEQVSEAGTLGVLWALTLLPACVLVSKVFVPVFCDLGIGSAYEYFEMRFGRSVRVFASVLYLIMSMMLLISTLYLPAFYLNQVAGLNLHFVAFFMTIISLFAAQGGLKIIVWTSSYHVMIQTVAFFTIICVGTYKAGGLEHILKTNYEGDQFNIAKMNFNTFWTALPGSFFTWCSALVASQESVQRYISVPTANEAKRLLLIYWTGTTIAAAMSIYGGLLTYAVYSGCDPIKGDHCVLDKIGNVPILPGLFIAGIFSSALSRVSAVLNAMALTLYEDCIKGENVADPMFGLIIGSIVIGIGCFGVIMVFVVEKLGDVIAVCHGIAGVVAVPIFAMFLMGMVLPFVNCKGALVGGMVSLVAVAWIGLGASVDDTRVDRVGAGVVLNATFEYLVDDVKRQDEDKVFFVYKLSHLMYKPVGVCIALIVGTAVSYLTSPVDPSAIDPNLICPQIRIFMLRRKERRTRVLNKLIDNRPADEEN